MRSDSNFGDMVKRRRLELRYSLVEFADLMGTTPAMITRYENGQEPELLEMKKLAKALEARVILHPDQHIEIISEQSARMAPRGLPLSRHLGVESGNPIRTAMKTGIRKVIEKEGIPIALRVFADEMHQPAKDLFMKATGVTELSGTPCLSKLFGKPCGLYKGNCDLHAPPYAAHSEIYFRDGSAQYYVIHLYKMTSAQQRDLTAFCDRHDLVYLIWPHLNWYFTGSAMAIIIQRKEDEEDVYVVS